MGEKDCDADVPACKPLEAWYKVMCGHCGASLWYEGDVDDVEVVYCYKCHHRSWANEERKSCACEYDYHVDDRPDAMGLQPDAEWIRELLAKEMVDAMQVSDPYYGIEYVTTLHECLDMLVAQLRWFDDVEDVVQTLKAIREKLEAGK